MPLRLPLAEYNRELGPSPFQTLGSVDFYQVPTDLVNLVRHHLILIETTTVENYGIVRCTHNPKSRRVIP
jgi:hypothetical protein